MKRKIYKLLSSAKQGLFAFALTLFSFTAYSQVTYTLNYTGSVQTLTLLAGTYNIKSWGGDGYTQTAGYNGRGGYASGVLTLASTQTVYIYVGGLGSYPSVAVTANAWTFNGGGIGYPAANSAYGNGGGASDVRTVGGLWDNPASLASRVIVAGGGGAGRNSSYIGGNAGGLTGGTGTYYTPDQASGPTGGSQIAGGTNTGYTGLTLATLGKAMTWDGTTLAASFLAGGGGGYYGGASGRVAGGGGSSYIGGVTSGTTIMYGQTGFVSNPDVTGNGMVIITELCSVKIYASGSNSINPAICSGNSLTLTTTAASNYTWSNGNTTTTSIVVSPTASQSYSIIGTSTAACQSTGFISVTVNSVTPVLTITNTPNSICLGQTAILTAGGALSYTWAGGPGGVINGQSFLPTATSNYTVTGQNGCGTTTSVTTITIAPLAVNASASPSLSCSGNPVTMTVSAAATGYTWSPGPVTGSNVIVAPVANTVYTVTASDGTCSGVTTVTINTKANPTISIVASSQTVCEGALVTMTASGALSYTWISPSSNAPNISDNPTTATLYQVSGTNSLNCVSSSNQLVFTTPSPTVTITSSKSIVCSGDPVSLTASGATTYNWTNGPATAGNLVNPTGNTSYTVTGTTSPCSGTAAITINVLTASVQASASTPSICNGDMTSLHASGATTYTWVGQTPFSPGNANVTPSVTTIYTVNALTISAGLSCPSSTNITITVFNNPIVTIVPSKTVVCKSDPSIVLTGGGAVTYTWSTATVSTNINVHPQSTTTYSITGVDANGCMNTAFQVITVNVCAGIAELSDKKNTISLYPNPNNGTFTLKSDAAMDLILVNELGQHLRSFKLQESANFSVEIKNLIPGIYFIVNENGSGAVQKIVVN